MEAVEVRSGVGIVRPLFALVVGQHHLVMQLLDIQLALPFLLRLLLRLGRLAELRQVVPLFPSTVLHHRSFSLDPDFLVEVFTSLLPPLQSSYLPDVGKVVVFALSRRF